MARQIRNSIQVNTMDVRHVAIERNLRVLGWLHVIARYLVPVVAALGSIYGLFTWKVRTSLFSSESESQGTANFLVPIAAAWISFLVATAITRALLAKVSRPLEAESTETLVGLALSYRGGAKAEVVRLLVERARKRDRTAMEYLIGSAIPDEESFLTPPQDAMETTPESTTIMSYGKTTNLTGFSKRGQRLHWFLAVTLIVLASIIGDYQEYWEDHSKLWGVLLMVPYIALAGFVGLMIFWPKPQHLKLDGLDSVALVWAYVDLCTVRQATKSQLIGQSRAGRPWAQRAAWRLGWRSNNPDGDQR
jgi:hypothetical protein